MTEFIAVGDGRRVGTCHLCSRTVIGAHDCPGLRGVRVVSPERSWPVVVDGVEWRRAVSMPVYGEAGSVEVGSLGRGLKRWAWCSWRHRLRYAWTIFDGDRPWCRACADAPVRWELR